MKSGNVLYVPPSRVRCCCEETDKAVKGVAIGAGIGNIQDIVDVGMLVHEKVREAGDGHLNRSCLTISCCL